MREVGKEGTGELKTGRGERARTGCHWINEKGSVRRRAAKEGRWMGWEKRGSSGTSHQPKKLVYT